jgi:hypothetical protein
MAAKKAATPYAYKYAAPTTKNAKQSTGAVPTKEQAKQSLIASQTGIIDKAKPFLAASNHDAASKANAQAAVDKAQKQIDTYKSKDYVMSNQDYMNSPPMQVFTSNPNNVKFLNNSSDQAAVDFRADQLKAQYGGILGADGKPAFDDKYFTGLASGKYDPKAFNADLTKIATAEMTNPNYGTDYTKVSGGTTGKIYQGDLAKLAGDPAALLKVQAANKAAIDAGKKPVVAKTPEQITAEKAAAEYKANWKPYTTDASGYNSMYANTPNKRLTQSGADTDANLSLDRGIASLAKANMPPAAGTTPPAGNAPPVMAPPTLSTVNRLAPNATTGMLPSNTAGIIGLPTTAAPAIPVVPPKPMKKGGIATLPATNKFVAKTHKVPVTGIANALKSKMGKK